MSNDTTRYDATRLRQLQHEEAFFEQTTAILDRFATSTQRKSTCINSNIQTEVECDYFKDAKFSRG